MNLRRPDWGSKAGNLHWPPENPRSDGISVSSLNLLIVILINSLNWFILINRPDGEGHPKLLAEEDRGGVRTEAEEGEGDISQEWAQRQVIFIAFALPKSSKIYTYLCPFPQVEPGSVQWTPPKLWRSLVALARRSRFARINFPKMLTGFICAAWSGRGEEECEVQKGGYCHRLPGCWKSPHM